MKMPSDVCASPSLLLLSLGVCRKKPLLKRTAVTTPSVVTTCPATGELAPLPWIWSMGMAGAGGAEQSFAGKLLLRGLGALMAKSATLLFVSVHPPNARLVATVLPGAELGPAPSKQPTPVP